MNTNNRFWFRSSHIKIWGIFALLIFLFLWLGVPTYKKWRADKLVDQLCAKDGRGTVYETVPLPADKFVNGFAQVRIPSLAHIKSTDEYYYTNEITWIIPESTVIGGLDLFRSHYKLFRVLDRKLLSEHVSYSRRGGDPLGPWHPSSYSCRDNADINVYPKTFILQQNGGDK